jgi:hypothetical protein
MARFADIFRSHSIGVCAVNIAYNYIQGAKQFLGNHSSKSGAASRSRSIDDSISYANEVTNDYLMHLPEGFYGRVAEVGPGDSCAVALKIVENGADRVDLIDRFHAETNRDKIEEIHRTIIKQSDNLSEKFGVDCSIPDKNIISRFCGPESSAERFFATDQVYDLIVSRAVLEHVQNVGTSIVRMSRSLRPGGSMVHIVDLRDHGMFTSHGYPETEFMKVPDFVYRRMSSMCGHPNRVPVNVYRSSLQSQGLDFDILVNRLVGEELSSSPVVWDDVPESRTRPSLGLIREAKASFAASLRDVPDQDLAISGFTIVARKNPTGIRVAS